MSLRDSLEIYNTSENQDPDLLDIIFKKVSNNYVAGSTKIYKINKIVEAFNDFNYVLLKFEHENEAILDEIKRYVMGCKIDTMRANKLKIRMKEWALFFEGIGIEPTFLKCLIDRYRKDFIIQYSMQGKKQLQPLIYLEYFFLIRNLSVVTQEEQIKILEEFKVKDKKTLNFLSDYIMSSGNGNVFINKFININEMYLKKLMNEEFLLKTIRDIFDKYIEQYNYTDYEIDLKRIYFIQNEIKSWVDITKLNNFILDKRLEILKEAYLIDEINEDGNHIIKLTEIGASLVTNQFVNRWNSDDYFYKNENIVLIPFNSNPILICKYLFDKNYIIKEREFLIIFERENDNSIF